MGNAAILLSGGLDSTAALIWAQYRYEGLLAITFDYGQPNRDQELSAARRMARTYGVRQVVLRLADALPRGRGILGTVEAHDGRTSGLSPAFVPGRNIVFLSCAAARADAEFPAGSVDLIIGANAQDGARFPDCRPNFLASLAEAIRQGVGRQIAIVAPWARATKTEILSAMTGEDLAAVSHSWSCYRGEGPCGTCGACVQRGEAFEAAGIRDASGVAMVGDGESP